MNLEKKSHCVSNIAENITVYTFVLASYAFYAILYLQISHKCIEIQSLLKVVTQGVVKKNSAATFTIFKTSKTIETLKTFEIFIKVLNAV